MFKLWFTDLAYFHTDWWGDETYFYMMAIYPHLKDNL